YAYVAPSPAGLDQTDLSPARGMWVMQNNSPLALLPNKNLLDLAPDQQLETIAKFFELVYKNGLERSGWNTNNIFYTY
ncbi:MAG: DUF5996 family protein, partial [Chloroflexota bacterium]